MLILLPLVTVMRKEKKCYQNFQETRLVIAKITPQRQLAGQQDRAAEQNSPIGLRLPLHCYSTVHTVRTTIRYFSTVAIIMYEYCIHYPVVPTYYTNYVLLTYYCMYCPLC